MVSPGTGTQEFLLDLGGWGQAGAKELCGEKPQARKARLEAKNLESGCRPECVAAPTNACKRLRRRLPPLTHVLSPGGGGARRGWKGLARVQPLIGSLCAEHNPTPVADDLLLPT